jgi:mannose-1-phosphate guanylyltransferase
MPNPLYALILAGGTGSRLWPRSRTHHPKQFLDLMGELTMLQQAQARLVPLIQPKNTFVATGRQYLETAMKQLPDVPAANILGEPVDAELRRRLASQPCTFGNATQMQ